MICIELEDATLQQYDKLYEEMARIDVVRKIQDPYTNEWFKLPRSQYHYVGVINNRETMATLVDNVLKRIILNYKITVTGDDGSAWTGLEKTTP